MQYYNERHGLIPENEISISLGQLKKIWKEIYDYFKSNGFLQLAEVGIEKGNSRLTLKMAPSPEQFLFNHTRKLGLYPISNEKLNECTENDIFTLIEIYYDQVENCEWKENESGVYSWQTEKQKPREDYAAYVNNILRFYKAGFYLEPERGFVMALPNEALKQQLNTVNQSIPDDVYQRLSEATKNYYRFDANLEGKRKAVASLADILEPIRNGLASLFNKEFGDAKKNQDALIFEIVNKCSIRHNNEKQCANYSMEIWLDWMMQYYTSVIIAFYRLSSKKKGNKKDENSDI